MPQAFSAFWLSDMQHADGERAALIQLPKRKTKCKVAFFPGCQLGASDPRYVLSTLQALRQTDPETGLLLCCCGAPAHWAGQEELHRAAIQRLRAQWEGMGKPTLLFACPTCKKMFTTFLPEISSAFVYQALQMADIDGRGQEVSIFDPCASRGEPKLQQHVRDMLMSAGYVLSPLAREREHAQCCSFGGQIAIANPQAAHRAVRQRIAQSDYPYITYCTNCRDTFALAQKPVAHILDVLFGLNGWDRRPPTWSQRRRNRELLKNELLGQCEEETAMQRKEILEIAPEMAQKLSENYLLEEDIRQVVAHCEQTGEKLYDASNDCWIGHLQIGYLTHWVVYRQTPSGFVLQNAYAHRMQIQEEQR